MRLATLFFLFGIIFCQTLSFLPDIRWTILIFPLGIFIGIFPRYRLVFLFALGLLWAIWRADMILAQKLPHNLESINITIIGTVINLPKRKSYGWQFEFSPLPLKNWVNPGHLHLSWYGMPPQTLRPGQQWQLTVRLKRVHGTLNPGVFDYSQWLFQRKIVATGAVVRSSGNLLSEVSSYNIDSIRYHLAEEIRQTLGERPSTGIIIALALGDKQGISQKQQDILKQTGIAHLVAISGLHIGFIAWLFFLFSGKIWKTIGKPYLLPTPYFAALFSLLGAFIYALLAGFSLPTQRALIMVIVVVSATLFSRKLAISYIFTLTLLIILLWDPLSIISTGFWLSFGAVAVIIYALSGKDEQNISPLIKWGLRTWRTQWAITLGLFPISLFVFNYFPIVSPLANAIAIPWVSFIIVPLTLLGTVLISIVPTIGHALLLVAANTLDALWVSIEYLANWGVWQQYKPPLWTVIVGMIGVAILLLPRGFPGRYLGIIWLLPLFFSPPALPNRGEVWFTLLDVGQGLSAVVRTENYVLLYDTGTKFSSRTTVLPFLHALGIKDIDKLLISHDDNDHSGGTQMILKNFRVKNMLSGMPKESKNLCQAGQHWRWDDVDFQILHPTANLLAKDNNRSCVLKISSKGGVILLTGDIEKSAEYQLIHRYQQLKADILIVPHHGSNTSSTTSFINTVQPKIALISAGYRNRFGHPNKFVMQRYKDILVLETAKTGAIQFKLSTKGISAPWLARDEMRHYWHNFY